MGRNGHRRGPAGKSFRNTHAVAPPHFGETLGTVFHRRDRRRHQQASRIVARSFGSAGHAGLRFVPCRVVESGRFPAPGVGGRVDLLARSCGIITVDARLVRFVGAVVAAQPTVVRIDGLFGRCVALYDQPGLVEADLGDRFHFREVPYDGCQRIFAGFQPPGQIDRFEVPVEYVAAGRADRSQLAVDVQLVTVVGRDVHDEPFRLLGKVERFSEMVNPVSVLRFSGDGNPLSRPASVEPLRRNVGLAVSLQMDLGRNRRGKRAQDEANRQVKFFHRFSLFST